MIQKQKSSQQVEILAPAGSYESFCAAIEAGADAVYAGGPRFGARAYAENFTEELLLQAIDYAHLHDRRFYLTVNTLLKDPEMDTLYEYLEPLYLGGLDAVIVQDLGVFDYVRTHFPGMDLHVSTQMTVTAPEGARFLQEQGAVRVVPARELSLKEIRDMKNLTGMEIECFVHGALCYCYSGQCLLSSLIGGRSGNRGQCAQPCRLPYNVNGEKKHWLSPKDICTLELIPDLVDAGIDSFKIEGRMKRPEYVAGVTAMYRKYVDLYLQKGRKAFSVSREDKEILMDLYNRGGFNKGYYKQHNGKDMMSLVRPSHAGVPAVKVDVQKGREVTGRTLTTIHKGDVLEFSGRQENYTFGSGYEKGAKVCLPVPKGQKLRTGSVLYRTKNEHLLQNLAKMYLQGKRKEKIQGELFLSPGEPAKLTLQRGGISVDVYSGEKAERAKKRPLDEAAVLRQLKKTGNTEFEFEQLEVRMDPDVFLGMQQINELRRQGTEALEMAVCESRHRVREHVLQTEAGDSGQRKIRQNPKAVSGNRMASGCGGHFRGGLTVLAETKEQIDAAAEFPEVRRIYADSAMGGELLEEPGALELCQRVRKEGTEVFLAMPHIFREETERLFLKRYPAVLKEMFDGVLVRNLESLQFLKKCGFDRTVILDHNLYVFNHRTKEFWRQYGADGFTVPLELNRSEIEKLGVEEGEMILYGYLPVMISAQCVTSTASGCRKQEKTVVLKDRFSLPFPVRNRCRECYNVIYNSAPLYLLDQKKELEELAPCTVRLQLSGESKAETQRILKMYRRIFVEDGEPEVFPGEYTRGHFRRGIL